MFKCKECGYRTLKWLGKCPECDSWDSFVEEEERYKRKSTTLSDIKPQYLNEIKAKGKERVSTGLLEFDRVIGGGVVIGSIVLVSGEPGIGKSTLLLTISGILSREKKVILLLIF